jgi:hypothetical protein
VAGKYLHTGEQIFTKRETNICIAGNNYLKSREQLLIQGKTKEKYNESYKEKNKTLAVTE